MRKVMAIMACVPLAVAFMAGCGGNGNHPTTNDVPVVLTIQDQPPAGLTVVSFTVEVTGVNLQGTGAQSNVSLLTSPVTVNLSNLQTMSGLLANTTAPSGTYSGIMITFANASITLLNNSTTTFTDGTTSCPPAATTTTTCTLVPAFNPTSTTITTSPFPVTLASGTPVNIALDFNTSNSIANASGTLSISPTVTVSTNTTTNTTTGNLNDFTNVTGQVTALGSNQFTVTDSTTGQPLTLGVGTTSTFNNFNTSATCTTANTFACIQKDQIVSLNFGTTGVAGSTPTATSISLQNGISRGVQGTVIGVDPNSNSLQVAVTSVSPAFTAANPGVAVGQVVTVNPGEGATFTTQSNGQTIPAGLNFTTINNVGVGQSVMLNSTGFTAGTGGANGVLTTDQVMLAPTQFNGTVNSLNSTNQSLTLNGLNGVFTSNGTTIVGVDTGTTTSFMGTTGGFTGLMNGNNLAVGGLLFQTDSGPILVGQQVNVLGTTTAASTGTTGTILGSTPAQ